MKNRLPAITRRAFLSSALFIFLIFELVFAAEVFCSEEQAVSRSQLPLLAFKPGEILQYEISWSRMIAGTAVMTVQQKRLADGKPVLSFILNGKSSGMVDKFFPVNDIVQSVYDPESMQSLSYTISESFGKKKRHRTLVFDPEGNTVVERLNNDPPKTISVPDQVQDGLASLYYLRTRSDFKVGTIFLIDVHDGGKNWAVEVHTLGRERVRTDAGEFATIKVKTRPLHEGVFQNKGEVYIWLTDDSRKVPVLMKSMIKRGVFVFKLKDMKPGA
jgi:hypothetical protein